MRALTALRSRGLPALAVLGCLFVSAPAASGDVLDQFAWVLTQLDNVHANPFPVTGADVGASRDLFQCLDQAANDPQDPDGKMGGCFEQYANTPAGQKAWSSTGVPSWFWDLLGAYVDFRTKDYGGVVAKLGEAAICIVAQVLAGGSVDVCGLVKELVELAKDVYAGGKALWYGAGSILGLNDPKAMSQEAYYAGYWEPWFHAGTQKCLLGTPCPGLGDLEGKLRNRCKSYFASHDMTESTAESACGVMKGKYGSAIKGFATALPIAAVAYVETIRPLAKMWAVDDYGNDKALAQNKATFVQGCVNSLVSKFPFPTVDSGRCDAIKQSPAYDNPMLKPLLDKDYSECVQDATQQVPSPTAWKAACVAASPKFVAMFHEEEDAVRAELTELVGAGCSPPPGWVGAEGIKLVCDSYPGYQACLTGLSAGAEKKHCAVDQQKADERLPKAIIAKLGSKRCSAITAGVQCTRPWKQKSCAALLSQLTSGQATKVQCKGGPAAAVVAFAFLDEKAKNAVNTLNGARTINADSRRCQRPTYDLLAIDCKADEALVPQLKALNLGFCPEDHNQDGADVPCVLMTMGWQRVVATEKGLSTAPVLAAPATGGGGRARPLPPKTPTPRPRH